MRAVIIENLSRTTRPVLMAGVLGLLGMVLGGCGTDHADATQDSTTVETVGASPAASPVPRSETVVATLPVRLVEWSVLPATPAVRAGDVMMAATNTGQAPHDLVIVRSDAPLRALPLAGDRVDEERVTIVGRFQEFKSGEKEKHFQLSAGRYLLICNLPAHYQKGMVAELTVQ